MLIQYQILQTNITMTDSKEIVDKILGVKGLMNKGDKFVKKRWCCVDGRI